MPFLTLTQRLKKRSKPQRQKANPQTPAAKKLTLKEARLTPEQMRTPAQKLAIEEAKATPNKKQQLTPEQKKELKKAKTLKAQIETTEEALKSLNDRESSWYSSMSKVTCH